MYVLTLYALQRRDIDVVSRISQSQALAVVVADLRRDVARHQLQGLVLISAFPSATPPQTSLALLSHILGVKNVLLCHSIAMTLPCGLLVQVK